MCPDRDLISAFVDGEVPSPWLERIEEHLGSCAGCAAVAAGYREIGVALKAEVDEGQSESLARVRSRLDDLLLGIESPPAVSRAPRRPAGIILPLPLAAAAALLVILLAGATTLLALRPSRGGAIQTVAYGEISPAATPAKAQPASMDELLRYLEARDGQVTLTINLPSGATFGSSGKPVIMRGMPVGGRSP